MPKNHKYKKLQKILSKLPRPIVVAYSGGVDSTLLLSAAVRAVGKNNVRAVIADSPIYQSSEKKFALSFARKLGVQAKLLKTAEMNNPRFYKNPPMRCFHCKNELFLKISRHFSSLLKNKSSPAARKFTIVHGETMSDENDFRPGRLAAEKWKVRAPLKDAGFSKEDVRRISHSLGLPTHSKPAQPCLASRFSYGEKITLEKIKLVGKAEDYLRKKITGFSSCNIRVRYYSTPTKDHCARIEVAPPKKMLEVLKNRRRIVRALKKIGFLYVSLDIEGFRTGSANLIFRRKT